MPKLIISINFHNGILFFTSEKRKAIHKQWVSSKTIVNKIKLVEMIPVHVEVVKNIKTAAVKINISGHINN